MNIGPNTSNKRKFRRNTSMVGRCNMDGFGYHPDAGRVRFNLVGRSPWLIVLASVITPALLHTGVTKTR